MTLAVQLTGTLWVLGIAYVVKYLAFGVRAAETAVRGVDPSLEEAARISGATAGRAFRDVTIPIARPALIAAWILAFLPAATELTVNGIQSAQCVSEPLDQYHSRYRTAPVEEEGNRNMVGLIPPVKKPRGLAVFTAPFCSTDPQFFQQLP